MTRAGAIVGAIIGTVIGTAFGGAAPFLLRAPVPNLLNLILSNFSTWTATDALWIPLITLPFTIFGLLFGIAMSTPDSEDAPQVPASASA